MRYLFLPTFVGIALSVLLALNIFASQVYNPLLFKIIKLNDKNAVKQFLRSIEKTDAYADHFDYFNNLYNDAFLKETQQNKFSISQEIQKYEGLLQTNPKSRDVLIKLALLYLEQNEPRKARTYYAQAKKIDPWISISILEGIEE